MIFALKITANGKTRNWSATNKQRINSISPDNLLDSRKISEISWPPFTISNTYAIFLMFLIFCACYETSDLLNTLNYRERSCRIHYFFGPSLRNPIESTFLSSI